MELLDRIPEPEAMETWEDAVEYDHMDFTEVNSAFVQRALELAPPSGLILDCGTGTGRIPILMLKTNLTYQVIAVDLSENMLRLASMNIEKAKLGSYIRLRKEDAKHLPFPDEHFDMIVSNSIVHHVSAPLQFFKEIQRVAKPGAALLVRDLIRPSSTEILETLVQIYAGDSSERQQELYRDSLRASFTIKEIEALVKDAGLDGVSVVQSSDRHWSLERHWVRQIP